MTIIGNLKEQQEIENLIFTIRGVQVMMNSHLAELYGVELRILNQAVKRNSERFPEEFMFQLNKQEWDFLRSQIVTLKTDVTLRSQIATLNDNRGKHRKYMPYVFTEPGVAMLSAVLRSETAVKVSIQIIQAFVQMRKFIAENAAIFHRLDRIERKQLETVLTLFSKRNKGVSLMIFTKNTSKQMTLDVEKFNSQYEPVKIIALKEAHDRFLILDEMDVYHFGASLKDLCKKWFAFSKLDIGTLTLIEKLKTIKS